MRPTSGPLGVSLFQHPMSDSNPVIINSSTTIEKNFHSGKAHPLEGSCQEAILLPHTTFDVFSVAFRSAHSTPAYARRRIRVFIPAVSALMRRTSHPSGSRPHDVSQSRQTSAPGIVDAPENPRFPAVSNCVQRTDPLAPSRVHFFQGSRQRRRTTQPCGGRPYDGG